MRSSNSYQDLIEELRQILEQYDLGELVNFELNQRGFVNTGFFIETVKNGSQKKYFLRRYKPGIHEEELIFEHNLINHLSQQTKLPVARLYRTINSDTFLQRKDQNLDSQVFFYAVFEHLPGEDRYTWVAPHCSRVEIDSAARTLAQFHSAVTTLQPRGKRYEPGIRDLLSLLPHTVVQSLKQSKNTVFDEYLSNSRDSILQNIKNVLDILQTQDAWQMPRIVIHCDFHPGNLKFRGETVSGLFDFDWSKIDYRSFDLGLAIWYFFAGWESVQDGQIRVEEAQSFLEEYLQTMQELPGIGQLTPTERRYLPEMINAGNLYVLNWTILDYYNKNVDPSEYLKYLRHSVNSIRWYGDKQYHLVMKEL